MHHRLPPLLLLLTVPWWTVACDGNGSGPDIEDPPYQTQRDIVRLELTPSFIALSDDSSQQLTVSAVYDDGESLDVTGLAEWVVPEEYLDLLDVDGGVLTPLAVGRAQFYARFAGYTSNMATVEVGQFDFSVVSLEWDGVEHDGNDDVPQGNLVKVTVQIEGRTLPVDRPDLIELDVDGFVPFGDERPEAGLDPYFAIEDETTYSGWFLVAPSIPAADYPVTLVVEDIAGNSDDTISVVTNVLPAKTCDELYYTAILDRFDVRRYRVNLSQFPVATLIEARATDDLTLDTALWLFDAEGDLFTATDDTWDGRIDAELPMGITDRTRGTYYLLMTASPLAETEDNEIGGYEIECHEEDVTGDEFLGSTQVPIPASGGPISLDVDITSVPFGHTIDQAWVHLDIDSDAPAQVTTLLTSPDRTIALRSTGHDATRLPVTWGTVVDPDDSFADMSDFIGDAPNGTWTLQVENHSTSGDTLLQDWRLYIEASEVVEP
jgi:hypothetical protein